MERPASCCPVGSIEPDFNRAFSPDSRTALVGDEVVLALSSHDCVVTQHTETKWIPLDELLVDGEPTEASLAFAAFVGLRTMASFTPAERREIADLIRAKQTDKGVAMSWDVITIAPSEIRP